MSLLTNKYQLPPQVVSAIMRDSYVKVGDVSATQLNYSARIFHLKSRHALEIVEDASDRIWALLGTIGHKILERSDDFGALHEQRLSMNVNGWIVSGMIDAYTTQTYDWEQIERMNQLIGQNAANGDVKLARHLHDQLLKNPPYEPIEPTIQDYKFIKVLAGKFENKDWERQGNVNAHLWRSNGFKVSRIQIVAIYRDWSKVLASVQGDYPPPIQIFEQKMWTPEQCQNFLENRVKELQVTEVLPDDLLPFCTLDDQWRRGNKWAVMQSGRKRALRTFDHEALAVDYIQQVTQRKRGLYIEFRASTPMRCLQFCDVKPFCNQFRIENPDKQTQEACGFPTGKDITTPFDEGEE